MNRRTALRRLAVISGLALAAPVLAAPRPARMAAAEVEPAIVATTAVDAVTQLAAVVGAPAWCPATHLLRRSGSASLAGRTAAERTAARGYADADAALVYRAAGDEAGAATLFFAVADAGGAHALAPFLYPVGDGHGFTLLGGPALVGLAACAHSLAAAYSHLTGAALGRALLPTGDYGYEEPSFEFDDEWKAFYPTRDGAVGLTYTPERRPHYEDGERLVAGTGTLALVLFDMAQEVRDARTYRLAYREARIPS